MLFSVWSGSEFDISILLINVLSAAMGGAAIFYFFYTNFGLKSNILKAIGFILTFGLVNGLISSYLLYGGDMENTIKPIVLLFISVAVIQIFFKAKIHQSFIAFFVYTLCIGIGNSFMPLLLNLLSFKFDSNNMLINPLYLLLVNIVCNIIAFTVILLIKPLKIFTSQILVKNSTFPILLLTFLVLVANSAMYSYIEIFNLSAYIIITALSILYCIYVILISSKLIKNETSKLEIEQQKFYSDSLNVTLFNLRRFKHDWGNNLAVINSMLTMNKISELKKYMSELINQSVIDGDTTIYSIKNAGLFGIISAKLNLARNKGVTVDFTVLGEVESIPGIKISELCEVVGIFIDNAIEEAIKSDRIIKLNIISDEKHSEISISNSCTNKPDMKLIYEAGYSSKGDGRGMGLSIARKILGNCKNILHASSCEDNTFTQTITIKKGL